MEEPIQNSTLLELHVPDFDKAKDFYSKLGFEVVWEREPEGFKGYLVMKKGNNHLCFWAGNENVYNQEYFHTFPHDTKPGYGVEIIIMAEEDIDELYKVASNMGGVVGELQLRPWGLKDFRIEDPFGYYLRFTEPHNILLEKYAVK